MQTKAEARHAEREFRQAELAKLVPKRYVLVAGHPVRMHTGTTTFSELNIVGYADTAEECRQVTAGVEGYSDLMLWIDRETGKTSEPQC